MSLNPKAFALASGLFWGIALFVTTWWLLLVSDVEGEKTLIGLIYPGYRVTPAGSVIGFLWLFVDGMLGGALFAWLYNRLAGRSS